MFLVGAAAGFLVSQGSLQQICGYKLNAESVASAEVDEGCEPTLSCLMCA